MSAILNLIKKLPAIEANDNVAADINYIRKSSSLVNDALQKGSDIMQLANGDIMITEVKTITYKYRWDKERSKFERVTSGSKIKKRRKNTADKE